MRGQPRWLQIERSGASWSGPLSSRSLGLARPRPDERWGKARALWSRLAQAGVVKLDTDAALNAYVQRQTKVEVWRFLNGYQINTVIESLKAWCHSKGVELQP